MRWISTGAQVSELDRRAIELYGVPSVALMETAAHGVAEAIRVHHADAARQGVVVACGAGNNGGDGYAVARWLYQWGFPVAVVQVAEPKTEPAKIQREAAFRIGVPFAQGLGRPGLLVDALLGTGVSRTVTGRFAQAMAAMRDLGVPCVAVDVPSGVDVDRGTALGPVVPAVRTVTFARLKPGLLCGDGQRLAGEIDLVDIGLAPGPELACGEMPERADLAWPSRAPDAHKGDSGHLVIIAGSQRMAGAAILACRGALAAGAGLLTLVAPRGAAARLAALPPEVMWIEAGQGGVVDELPMALLEHAGAVVAGPGLGGGRPLPAGLAAELRQLWTQLPVPVLFDADALPCCEGVGGGPRVITPHPGEAGRMLDGRSRDVQADRFGSVETLARTDRTVLLKGRYSLVASAGQPISVNPTNSPALATGGTGDVLSGVIGGLLARGVPAREAARLGAWVHGRAGELVEQEGAVMSASSVVERLPAAIAELAR
ncbi:MAG: NAD(P)H-hydrate dehydratase [Deltaproteobacteria bacterium]|nr:MAG: NAD(P)H-hydrate dehydratase [Deltaproteobacteria bacterium]